MKLVMTLLVRDEEDIIRDNIEFHLAQGVDFIIATDNLSKDSTTDILKEYEKQGVLKYLFEKEDNFNQSIWVTQMARLAKTQFNADWVINNDADEFWWPIDGDLKSTFENIPSGKNVMVAERTDFVATKEITNNFYESMIYSKKISLNIFGGPLPPKTAHLASSEIRVPQGNHSAEGFR
ncbi:MAG: glycosyltransferase family 92 protein, partial [Cytophagales bacterium]|nr:glycosyltransferase family 92 protein [Cytophagales bacterium]